MLKESVLMLAEIGHKKPSRILEGLKNGEIFF